ncbi:hypothetical protein [Sandaracinus amylolyticus]|uniref:Lipoprotein n=1 Tax=Sandaracinus amylolyticus TaxID=927083 RepID=A0A0F6W3T2_9BACT|nr:hypothetical protein [Sandaracinus amylolyticus]AKF06743.1 hypothetical protein DB32_003892 [Sandaracinus amylolyticus]
MIRTLLPALVFALVGCSSTSPPDRVRELVCAAQASDAQCSEACRAATTTCGELWSRIDELGSTMGACLDACPTIEVCDGGSQYHCDCYADCVAAQSEAVQDALLEANECELPPECR